MKFNTKHILVLLWLIGINNTFKATATNGILKDTNPVFDTNFKDRYKSDAYNYTGKKNVKKNTENKNANYAEYSDDKIKFKDKPPELSFNLNNKPITWLFLIILVIAIFYFVYILTKDGGNKLFKSGKNTPINANKDITEDNIDSTDLSKLIKNAEQNNNYRLAIRYYYLLTLKTLNLKKYIKFENEKTNAQYLNEISKKPFKNDFAYLQYLYNYIWYGKFSINTNQYNKAKNYFVTLLKRI